MEKGSLLNYFEKTRDGKLAQVCRKRRNKLVMEGSLQKQIKEAVRAVLEAASLRVLIVRSQQEDGAICLERQEDWETLLRLYPGLQEYGEILYLQQVQFWEEVLDRLDQDWEGLKGLLGEDGEEVAIAGVFVGTADSHCGGKRVVKFTTKAGTGFFYKPHGLENEIFLQEVIKALYEGAGMEGCSFWILNRGEYGWEEEVENLVCTDRSMVARFYRRSGMLAALGYFFGMGDLHYENVVACREFPVLVDAETLFENLCQETFGIAREFSVLSGGLFPGGATTKETAGITGGEGILRDRQVPTLTGKGSKRRIVYRYPHVHPGKNRVFLEEKAMAFDAFSKEVLEGFRRGYRWLAGHRGQLRRAVEEKKELLICRYVSRSTQFFALALSASTHPSLLQEKGKRQGYLAQFTAGRQTGRAELRALLAGDIPWFYRKVTDRALRTEQGVEAPMLFGRPILARLDEKWKQISREDYVWQAGLLDKALNLGKEGKEIWKENKTFIFAAKGGKLFHGLAFAQKIGEKLAKTQGQVDGEICWQSVQIERGSFRIRPCGRYFYEGLGGIWIFLQALNRRTDRYQALGQRIEEALFSYTERSVKGLSASGLDFLESCYTGMYCGESALMHTYQILYRMTGEEKYLRYGGMHGSCVARLAQEDCRYDLLYGNSGAVLVFCRQYLDSGDCRFLQEAERILALLESSRTDRKEGTSWFAKTEGKAVCSLAHGNSGMLLAYARVFSITKKEIYRERMRRIIAFENQYYTVHKTEGGAIGDWPDLRKDKERFTYAWCNGGMGVTAARVQAALWNPKETWLREEAQKGRALLLGLPMRSSMSLCHGNFGNYLLLRQAAAFFGEDVLWEKEREFREQLKALIRSKGVILPQERQQMRLMSGLAGIGLGCILMEEMERGSI